MSLCDKVRAVLVALDYTKEIVAVETGMTKRQVNRIFKEGGSIKSDEFLSICELIGLQPNAFIKGGVSA